MKQKDLNNTSLSFFKIVLLLILLMSPALSAEAKWWIFGKSDAGVSTRYIYINDLSYDEIGEQVTVYQESLPQGKIFIRGKGTAGKNRIGAVQISLDGKQTWQKAQVASDGSFVYSFTPELAKLYELYVKVLDTTGKSNDVEASRKELTVSDESILDQIYKVLDLLVKAYQDEDSFGFMHQVSDDFVSGIALLDSAIRQDFTAFDDIQLHYTLNNVTRASDGSLFVALSFSRMLNSSRSGEPFNDNATTEFTFKLERGMPKIYSMKNPLIFGLSDASNIATGTINSGDNVQVITVNSSGTVDLKLLSELSETSASVPSAPSLPFAPTTETLTLSDSAGFPADEGFVFSSGAITAIASSNVYLETNSLWSGTSATFQSLGSVAIEGVNSVPAGPYMDTAVFGFAIGNTYAVSLSDGTYGIIQISNYTDDGFANTTATIKYRYQPDGSTNF